MSLYVVGDVQGCYDALMRLLEKVCFDPDIDTLWAAGDLVNRGPDSLTTLRFFMQIKHSVQVVLGNHDLHLLAVAYGVRKSKKSDVLESVLDAADLPEITQWLRSQPLLHVDAEKKLALVHAGIPHIWTLKQAQRYAAEVQLMLQGDDIKYFLQNMYGNEPNQWHDSLNGWERLRLITNYLTRMRFCGSKGELDLTNKQGPDTAKSGYKPWFQFYSKQPSHRILFGHWASLAGRVTTQHVVALDTGCVWGGKLSLLAWEENKIYAVDCA